MSPDKIEAVYHSGLSAVMSLVAGLCRRIGGLIEEVEALKTMIASLQTDSTNSSKPPSSDGPRKKRGSPKRGSSGRKPGGQPGHRGKSRPRAPADRIDKTVEHKPTHCQRCHAQLGDGNESEVTQKHQVWEIPEILPLIIEHLFYTITCACGHKTRLPVPKWIYSGAGDNLQALIAYLSAPAAKLSRRVVQTILDELFHVPIGLGTIQNRLEDTSQALEGPCGELESALPEKKVTNIDETSYPHNGKLAWLWGFVTNTFAFFTIQASRGSKVIKQVLGLSYDGIIICDRFSAYVKYQRLRACGLIQLCWAHIIRDVKATKHAAAHNAKRPFSYLMLRRIGVLFRLWYAFKKGKFSRKTLIRKAQAHIRGLHAFLMKNRQAPSKKVRTLCTQLLKRWNSLFTFIYHEGVEPTNNAAERILRAGVQIRKISFCTRSHNGQLLLTRLLTVFQTCRMRNRGTFEFLLAAIRAKRHNLPPPSLLHRK